MPKKVVKYVKCVESLDNIVEGNFYPMKGKVKSDFYKSGLGIVVEVRKDLSSRHETYDSEFFEIRKR